MASVMLQVSFSDGDLVTARISAPHPSPDQLDDMRGQAIKALREACAELFVKREAGES